MKVAHIISHTHWDREWYLPYEKHHMRLVMLIDQVLEAIEKDPNFKSFHLDGQTICIDDYLQVKPQNKNKLLAAIKCGKIKIGPWYILQDAFLTSAEANVRNGYYGDLDCQRYGNKTSVGYYPDTFGIYSQAPQILKQLEINNIVFGRGVTTTGFNNEVSNGFESKYSEMNFQSSNGESVLGILFANWYSNGNEIPVDKNLAKDYWDTKLAECEQYTNLGHLLFMNGCDHTPYQSDVTKAIEVANSLYPDIEFKQSSFHEYLEAVESEVDRTNLTTISGELTSQRTDGMYTLVNTASSRINQKIENAKIQDLYEQVVEPLSALYSDDYMHEEIEYGWKKLMQNHPHDSICGCSIDSVHRTMDSRFEDARNVAEHIIDQILIKKQKEIACDGKIAFTVFNTMNISNTRHTVQLEYAREEFGSCFQEAREKMRKIEMGNLKIVDENNVEIPALISDLGIKFGYYLPSDKFRRPYYSRDVKVDFNYKFDFIGHKTFYLVESKNKRIEINRLANTLENDNIKVEINETGDFSILNKRTQRVQSGLLEIFDEGDVGNEYMFGAIDGDIPIYIAKPMITSVADTNSMQITCLKGTLKIPVSANNLLKKEQLEIVEYSNRKCQRSSQTIDLPISIQYELDKFDTGVKLTINIDNTAEDHRMRARFKLSNNANYHYVDSAFEVVKRNNKPLETWKNPNNDQRLAKFVRLENNHDALTIATCGLHEYEVIDDYIDITLLRSTGELGDWGYFPTPEAQCKYQVNAELYVVFDEKSSENRHATEMRTKFTKQPIIQVYGDKSELKPNLKMLDIDVDDNGYISAIKRNLDNDLIVRMGSNGIKSVFKSKNEIKKTNMLEQIEIDIEEEIIDANQILTLKIKR